MIIIKAIFAMCFLLAWAGGALFFVSVLTFAYQVVTGRWDPKLK